MTFSVYMVRHGQTQLNKYRRMQGWCDSPLTAKGIVDAHKAGRHLAQINFDRVYHSDMTRTARTCKIIMDENQATPQFDTPTALHYFREQCYGYFEGQDSANTWIMVGMPHGCKTFEELITKFSLEKARDMMKAVDPFHDSESDAEFWERVDAGFDLLRQNHHDGDRILLVSHGTCIRSIVHRYAPEIDIVKERPLNGSVTKLTVSPNNIQVAYYDHYRDDQEY